MENVLEWEAIADDFTDVLCLGNGASIALAEEFSYRSLLEEARKQELITEDLDELFEYLGTEDFELVLNLLWHAVHVNRALDISEDRTEEAYEAVRHALVQSVRENHADHADVVERLPSAYQFLKRFGTVHSLNYDLVLYWAMMAGNDELGNWFKDCFVRGSFHKNWEQFRRPHRAKGATLVFYPHGNLSLATSLRGEDQKVHREDDWDDLLYRITEQWNDGDLAPLFVTEGDSDQKVLAIRRSAYLSTVHDTVLSDSAESLVFHGFSFSPNDKHIVRQLARAKPARVAVSVFKGDRSDEDVEADIHRLRMRLKLYFRGADHYLYWATSEGAWIH